MAQGIKPIFGSNGCILQNAYKPIDKHLETHHGQARGLKMDFRVYAIVDFRDYY